jgi:hypothetical protein
MPLFPTLHPQRCKGCIYKSAHFTKSMGGLQPDAMLDWMRGVKLLPVMPATWSRRKHMHGTGNKATSLRRHKGRRMMFLATGHETQCRGLLTLTAAHHLQQPGGFIGAIAASSRLERLKRSRLVNLRCCGDRRQELRALLEIRGQRHKRILHPHLLAIDGKPAK